MNHARRGRFWIELVCAASSAVLAAITLAWPDWIEGVFGGLNPDGGDGSLEWLLVAALLAVAVASAVLARAEWRRAPQDA